MTTIGSKYSPESPTYAKTSYQAPHYTSSVESARTALSAGSNDVLVGEQWLVLGRIGEGSFGEVFEARDIDTNRSYAIKREPKAMRHPQLKHESIMYDALVGGPGIPACHWYGEHEDFNCIVIDLLGPSLKTLRQAVSSISLDIALNIACQLINTVEHIHSRGIIYRDIKPDNFLFPASFRMPDPDCFETQIDNGFMVYEAARPSCKTLFEQQDPLAGKLYAIDFGLASWWRNPSTNKPYPEGKRRIRNKTGTARYASLNVHRGREHSRRDDMESVGYLLLDIALGSLPWTGIQARNSRLGWDRMREAKEMIMLQDLCAGLPLAFVRYIEYCRALKFEDEPDYAYLRSLFEGAKDGGPYSEIVLPFDRSYLRDPNAEILSTISDQGTPQHTNDSRRYNQKAWSEVEHDRNNVSVSRDNDGIFTMDDISTHETGKPTQHDPNMSHSKGFGPKNGRQRSRQPSASSYKKLFKHSKEWKSNVGWNTHRRLQQNWEPKIDWETIPSVDKPSTSWGEDRPDGMWSRASAESKHQWMDHDVTNESWPVNNNGWDHVPQQGDQWKPNGFNNASNMKGRTGKCDDQRNHGGPFHNSAKNWTSPAHVGGANEVSSITTKMADFVFVEKDEENTRPRPQPGKRAHSKSNHKSGQHQHADDEKKGDQLSGTDGHKPRKPRSSSQWRSVPFANDVGTIATDTGKVNGGENLTSDFSRHDEEWQRVGSIKSDRKPVKQKSYKQTGGYGRKQPQKGLMKEGTASLANK